MKPFLNKWKRTIYRDDLIYVIVHGLLTSVIVGAAMGSINLFVFMNTGGYSFMIFIILIGYLTGMKIRKNYYNYHILYPTLAIFFTIIGYYIYNIIQAVQIYKDLSILRMIFNRQVFIIAFDFLLPTNGYFLTYENVWQILVFGLTLYLAYRNSKNVFID